MTVRNPNVIDNACCGIGDAVVYSWALHSANSSGERLRIYPRGARWVFDLLNAGRWCEAGEPNFKRTVGDHPAKGVVGGKGWLRHWLDEWGLDDANFVRPTNNLTPEELEQAGARWSSTGKGGPRILIFPEGEYAIRTWSESKYVRVGWMLDDRGASTIALLKSYRGHLFPYAIGGLDGRAMAAMIATADVVLGNESGPVHLAATLGVKSYCLYGGTRPELMHEQYGSDVVPIITTPDRVPCVGCNFAFDRGCRKWCEQDCFALSDITPFQVLAEITEMRGREPRTTETPSRGGDQRRPTELEKLATLTVARTSPFRPRPRPEHRDKDLEILDDVFDRDCYEVATMPVVRRAIDVGGCFGAFSAKLNEQFPGVEVAVAECVEVHQRRIRRVLEEHDMPATRLVPAAVYYGADDVALHTTMFDGSDSVGGSTVAPECKLFRDEYRDGGRVRAVTLEQIMDERGWEGVDLVKLDCEGAECNILAHCDLSRVGMFVGEWHDEAKLMNVVEFRCPGWRYEVIKSGLCGLFRLVNPEWMWSRG